MDASQFAEHVIRVTPSVEQIMSTGLSRDDAIKVANRAQYKRRSRPLDLEESNQVLALLKHWDLSKLEIGMISFLDQPHFEDGSVHIGEVEADPLLVALDTGAICVEELGTGGHLLWRVAGDDEKFLDALAAAYQFFKDRLLDTIDWSDTKIARRFAEKCASLAGGDEYLTFYLMLLGGE